MKRATKRWVEACAATRAHGSEVPKHATDILDTLVRLRAENRELRALAEYAQHRDTCVTQSGQYHCNCGFASVRPMKALTPKHPRKTR